MHAEPAEGQTSSAPVETDTAPGATAATVVTRARKKKPKYSKGLKEVQKVGRAMNKASARVTRAVAKGMATYGKRSKKSALKKRDGALRDLGVNLAEGLGKTLRALSDVPADLAKAMNGPRARKRVKRQLRATSRILRPR